jgi:hypothetical protein
LMRHAHPSGDFGLIIGRALELLIQDLMKRRFGAGARRKASPTLALPRAQSSRRRTRIWPATHGTGSGAETLATSAAAVPELTPEHAASS